MDVSGDSGGFSSLSKRRWCGGGGGGSDGLVSLRRSRRGKGGRAGCGVFGSLNRCKRARGSLGRIVGRGARRDGLNVRFGRHRVALVSRAVNVRINVGGAEEDIVKTVVMSDERLREKGRTLSG